MPHATKTALTELQGEAIFLWRAGQWHMQQAASEDIRPLSQKAARLLEASRTAGRLREVSPGLFRLGAAPSRPVVDSQESPLQRLSLLRQGDGTPVIDQEQLRAGERLRVDYEKAHMSPRVIASYDASQAAGRGARQLSDNHIATLTDSALAARNRLHQALDTVGPELSGILLQVCCMASGLEAAELRLNLPRRAGKAVLQLALTRLARHYGFKSSMRHAGPTQIGHWAVSDFRPQLQAPPAHQP